MSNLETVADLILRNVNRGCEGCYSPFGPCVDCEDDAADAAKALADAGLLAPELPEFRADYDSVGVPARSTLICHDDDCVRYSRDTVLVGTWHGEVEFSLGKYDEVSVYMSTEQARDLAYALLAAANYAEGHP